MVDIEDVPITYEATLANVKYNTKKMEFTKDDETTKVKLEFPIYEEQENQELLIKLIRQFHKAVENYDLFTLLGEVEVYDRFKQCLEGDALDTWEAIVVDTDQATWEDNLAQLVEVLIDDEAFSNQKDYIQETRKPNSMTMKRWILRLKAINSYLPYLGLATGESAMDEADLVKVVTRNIPGSWKARFRLANGHKAATVTEALKILNLIEKEDRRMGKINSFKGKGNGRSKGSGSGKKPKPKTEDKEGPRNPCKLPGHQHHDYSDCKFNPRSANYCGVTRTLKDYDKNGKLKDSAKKKEKENLKTERSSSDDNSTSDSSNENHYCSESDECEFHMIKEANNEVKNKKALSAELLVSIPIGKGSKKYITCRALADTGSSDSLASERVVGPRCDKRENTSPTNWVTKGGKFSTKSEGIVNRVKLPQFTTNRSCDGVSFHLFQPTDEDKYDFILGRDFLQGYGIDILNSSNSFKWDGIEVPMVPRGHWNKERINQFWKSGEVEEEEKKFDELAASRHAEEFFATAKILAAKYAPMDTDEVVEQQKHLSIPERLALSKMLRRKIKLFQGLRGNWKGAPIELDLVPGATPHSSKPFPIPHAYRKLVKEEVERLVEIGLLTKVESSEWSFPSFPIPKKDDTIRFVTDFRILNTKLVRKPFPLPLIHDIVQTLGKFMWATCIDLSMGYYSMKLSEKARKICVTCLPWGLYSYNMLPMGIKVATDIFQAAMGDLFADLEGVVVYLDDILIIGAESYEEHLCMVEEVLRRLEAQGMQVNPAKSFWAKSEVEYLGFLITRDGIKPQQKKIQSILNIAEPKTQRQLRSFVGMVNYYRSLWPKRSLIMSPLTSLTGKGTKFIWTKQHSEAFQQVKKMVAQDTMLIHPDFAKDFIVNTDASNFQIAGVVSQEEKPIAYFSRKFNTAQRKYTVTEKELLAIVETLKHFRNILLGHKIIVYTDHKNLTYPNSNYSSDRVLRQRLLVEEYGAELVYVKGAANVVADALSRLPIQENSHSEFFLNRRVFEDQISFPLDLANIKEEQKSDDQLERLLKDNRSKKNYKKMDKHGNKVWTVDEKIYVPTTCRQPMIEWYHEMLKHAGAERTAKTIRQYFDWPGAVEQVKRHVKICSVCQKQKITGVKKYGKIPFPDSEESSVPPFHTVHVDMIGPWRVYFKIVGKKVYKEVQALTIVDRATTWPEIIPTLNKESLVIAELFDKVWLCRYPRPNRIIHDNGNEFTGFEFQELCSSYGIAAVPTTVKNPRGNSPVERMHLTAADMLRTVTFTGENWMKELDKALQTVAWAIRSTVSTMSGYTPGQLVFNKDMIMQSNVIVDWEKIKLLKRASAQASNEKENKTRLHHQYSVGDKVLIIITDIKSKMESPTEGPYEIRKVYQSGLVKISRGSYNEVIHIRRLKPYHE